MIWRRASVIVAVVVATAIVALMGACTADRLGAPRLRPDSTLVRNWSQPDNLSTQLSIDPSNGGGETSPGLGDYPVDTKLYVIASGYVVRHDNYIANNDANL